MRNVIRLTLASSLFAASAGTLPRHPISSGTTSPPPTGKRKRCPSATAASAPWCSVACSPSALQIAEKSLWTGGPGTEGGYDYGLPAESQVDLMRAIGKQLVEGAPLEPEAVAKQLGRKMHNYGDYQSFGDLIIGAGADRRCRRRTIAASWTWIPALARVSFKQGGVRIPPRVFRLVSGPGARRPLVRHRAAEAAHQLRRAGQPQRRRDKWSRAASACRGALKSNGLRYAVDLRVNAGVRPHDRGRRLVAHRFRMPGDLRAGGAHQLPDGLSGLPLDGRSRSRPPRGTCWPAGAHFGAYAKRHVDDHQALFRRVELELEPGASKLPTDKLRAQYGSGDCDGGPRARAAVLPVRPLPAHRLLARRAPCRRTCRACGTTTRRRRGTPTTTSTSTCR